MKRAATEGKPRSLGMGNSVQRYVMDVVEGRRQGLTRRTVEGALWLLSKVYRFAVWVRTQGYESGVLRRHSLPCLTISVGNITVGGTGKTPFVEALARALRDRGRRIAVLSRGYKSQRRYGQGAAGQGETCLPKVVSDGQSIFLDSAIAGDEPYLLAQNLDKVAILVDKNRVRAGRYAVSQLGVDTLILDDGFQHLRLKRDVNIVLIDCTTPFGNRQLLPRGILREPLKSLRRAHCFVLTKTCGAALEPIREELQRLNPRAEIVETIHEPVYLEDVVSGRRERPDFVRGKDLYVLSAIARPESFEAAIEQLGGRAVKKIRFLDHHRFSESEIETLVGEASRAGAHAIVTTQKDAVRLPPLKAVPLPFFFLRVAIRMHRGEADLADWVSRICQIRDLSATWDGAGGCTPISEA
jgi:tetraacyldisaccharide 4'-kinase